MKNQIKTISNTEAIVTKSFKSRAVIFGTPEYKFWREYLKDFPNAEMVTKTIKKNLNKKKSKKIKYSEMIDFIETQPNSQVLLNDFERIRRVAKFQNNSYSAVLDWFMNMYKNSEDYKTFFAAENEKPTENKVVSIKSAVN